MTSDVEFLPIVHPLDPNVGTFFNAEETFGILAHVNTGVGVVVGFVGILVIVVDINDHVFSVVASERNELSDMALVFIIEVPFCI